MTTSTIMWRGTRTSLAGIVPIAALCLVSATVATAQPAKGAASCTPVGGTVTTNFVSPDTTLGVASGDLRGAVSATLLSVAAGPGGTTVFTVRHHWTTEAGDTIEIGRATATATETTPGLFAIVSYPVTIRGGTGKFAGAWGVLQNIGAVDLTTQRTVFRYSGEICVGRAK